VRKEQDLHIGPVALAQLAIGGGIVHNLHQDARPVDRVDRSQTKPSPKRPIPKELLHQRLYATTKAVSA
jgi:hypothetical protein